MCWLDWCEYPGKFVNEFVNEFEQGFILVVEAVRHIPCTSPTSTLVATGSFHRILPKAANKIRGIFVTRVRIYYAVVWSKFVIVTIISLPKFSTSLFDFSMIIHDMFHVIPLQGLFIHMDVACWLNGKFFYVEFHFFIGGVAELIAPHTAVDSKFVRIIGEGVSQDVEDALCGLFTGVEHFCDNIMFVFVRVKVKARNNKNLFLFSHDVPPLLNSLVKVDVVVASIEVLAVDGLLYIPLLLANHNRAATLDGSIVRVIGRQRCS